MLDRRLLRKDSAAIEARLKTKQPEVELSPLLELDEEIRALKTKVEELKNRRNQISKEIGEKKRTGQKVEEELSAAENLREEIARLDHLCNEKEQLLEFELAKLPNLPGEKSPVSQDKKDNVCLRSFGEKPQFSFKPRHHVEISESLALFDFKRAAKVAGSHFTAYCDRGAELEWALLNYMIDQHLENGYRLWLPPLLVRPEIAYGSANLPKFEAQLFKIHDEDHQLYLIPTSEMALMGLHREETFKEEQLPLKYVSYTPCFRREAGALGAQERGLIRMHQFNKVEMFAFALPQQSESIFEEMVTSAENLLKGLGLHFRTMELVTGDMSFAASRTIDLEVWLPGQERYYEVSSISHCTDFQARRSNVRFKHKEEKPEFVHTLNGSGLATSRLMVALLENNQREDGSIQIPLILHHYLRGMKELR